MACCHHPLHPKDPTHAHHHPLFLTVFALHAEILTVPGEAKETTEARAYQAAVLNAKREALLRSSVWLDYTAALKARHDESRDTFDETLTTETVEKSSGVVRLNKIVDKDIRPEGTDTRVILRAVCDVDHDVITTNGEVAQKLNALDEIVARNSAKNKKLVALINNALEAEKHDDAETAQHIEALRAVNAKHADLITQLFDEIHTLEARGTMLASTQRQKEKIEQKIEIIVKQDNTPLYAALGVLALFIFLFFLYLLRKKAPTLDMIADTARVSDKIKLSAPARVFTPGDKLYVDIEHRLDKEMYVYLIDINSREGTTLLYPAPHNQNRLSPNKRYKLPDDIGLDVVPPFGKDIVKAILCEVPLELPTISREAPSIIFADSRGFSNPNIEKMQNEVAQKSTVSDKDVIAFFRGEASKKGVAVYEANIAIETREAKA